MGIANNNRYCYSYNPMPTSTRFSVAIHVLTILAVKKDGFVSSEFIAKSVGTNPVVVRRILAALAAAGLVNTHAGTQGGAKLAVCPQSLTLLQVFDAVEASRLFRSHDPRTPCVVAHSVKDSVERLLQRVEGGLKNELANLTLGQIVEPAMKALQEKRD